MFVVIDWIDGSWKGTQVKIVSEILEKMWKKVKVLDYPRHNKVSWFAVDKYLNWEYGNKVTAKQASIFYAIDRFDDSFNYVNNIENYDYLISNRYVSASMIHQAWKISDRKEREEFLDWLYDLEYNIFKIPKPDKTIFLNVSPEMSQKLVLNKEARKYLKWWKKMDLHEEDKNHLVNAHSSAIEVALKYPDWVKIDCEINWKMLSIDEITQMILKEIL